MDEVVLDGVVALVEPKRCPFGLLDGDDEFDSGVSPCVSADLVIMGRAGGEFGGLAGRA
ncbi:hypothetical protein AB0950_38240 [Streptomyces sp. NPDC007189]|uniref:hypothetical protein n=1 Tax=Streptomyces sp. NPDC007189 TaxID=3154315 RepID=UPI00345142BB